MPSLADTLKSTRFPIDVDHLCRRAHFVACRRGGESVVHLPQCRRRLHLHPKRSYGIELSVFYHQNYRGRCEHWRRYGVVESVGKVFGLHPHCRLPTDHKHHVQPERIHRSQAVTYTAEATGGVCLMVASQKLGHSSEPTPRSDDAAPPRGTDGLSTHRWREPDSNHRSRSCERSLGCCRREMPDR